MEGVRINGVREFLLIEHGQEGCDHSIRCGTRVTTIWAETPDAAVEKALAPGPYDDGVNFLVRDYRGTGDRVIADAHLLYVLDRRDLGPDIEKRRAALVDAEDRARRLKTEADERQEFERLKQKFGGAP